MLIWNRVKHNAPIEYNPLSFARFSLFYATRLSLPYAYMYIYMPEIVLAVLTMLILSVTTYLFIH